MHPRDRRFSVLLATALSAFCCVATLAGKEGKTSNAPFLTPEKAVAKMKIPEGFEVSIYAAEPDIGEPIAFTFDGRGRVWVVENFNYVNRGTHKLEEMSRIQIFDDTDSDGVFDSKKLFTEKIGFSSGIAVGFGGVYLGTPPNLLFIPDANGDDVPDGEPEKLLDGWGIQDRHETLNSFIWGPDGWLYGCQGVFTRSLVGKPGATERERKYIDGGIWRFHPVKKEFEVFAEGLSNPWGFDFNDLGHGFATMCVIPHLFHIVQGGIYHKQSKPNLNPYAFDVIQTIRDHTNRRSAHGGARFYLADTFPKKYRDQLFMCNIHEHAVLTDYMEVKGSSYVGRHGETFMPTNDLAWVGFSVEIGPDGGVYILDWHDTDICGNSINFPDSGRIYRIMPKGAEKISRPNIGASSDLDLVKLQDHANDWYVRQARVELHARAAAGKLDSTAVHEGLRGLFAKAETSGKRLRALWALHATGGLDAATMLSHKDEHVRSWAVQLISETGDLSAATLDTFAQMAREDDSAVVRLYLASALQRVPIEKRLPLIRILAAHAADVADANIPRMLWYALEPVVPQFPEEALQAALSSQIPFLQESVARRMTSGSLSQSDGQELDHSAKWTSIVAEFAPGFEPLNVGKDGVVKLQEFRNEQGFQTHPKDKKTPCSLKRTVKIPAGQKTTFKLRVSYHPHGDWQLRVLANNEVLHDQIISYETVKSEWLDLEIDLSKFAGKSIDLILENRANNWLNEFGYWGSIKIESTVPPAKVSSTKKKRPNIIVILADDLGYGSVGCYGATKVRTPNIDRMAQEGIRFMDANTPSSVCTPTRYSLLMGEYPWRNPKVGLRVTPEPLLLPADQQNVASLLKAEGYATGCVGKWHLGFGEEPVAWQNTLKPGPLERGFEYYFGFPINLNNEPVVYIENHQLIHPEERLAENGKSGAKKSRVHLDTMTDTITGKAVSFIEKNKDQPFFLYYATHQVHIPIHPAPRFKGKSEAGLYGDFIEDCDWSVGQILDTLDRLELSENTLVFFTSDNGAIGWPAQYKGELTGGKDGEFGLFRNAPWSGFKFGSEQGGSRVPFVARWPGKIKPGSETDALVSLTDFYATFRELLEQKEDGQGMDSVSFLGHLLSERKDVQTVRRSHTVYHAGKNSFLGIREKEWLLTFGGTPKQIISGKTSKSMPGKLYHLTKDPKEKKDVFNQYPGVVQRMEQKMRKELEKKKSPFSVSQGKILKSE